MELEMTKQILVEIFHARPSEVEDMIQNRHEAKNWKSRLARSGGDVANRILPGVSRYGRSFESVRMEPKRSQPNAEGQQALKKEKQIISQKLAEMAT